ncbi:abortive infection system antitoxin AbiGi family protein [Dyadobacter sp. CY347]|uniref:abortive infection system antitoxin AbiGi family protein n=1 Tax=Dyadobacter sp. CY347 TaxID=2909336 RepID=UPI001F290334|nr:abortive infection system antitoxin AbiGi family protein [Dyadobacter sp. CY347]MCF2488087.1 abortive infection system antitoxin AbiGi family protein [Dyadobacter sp. CY347]
MPIRSTSLFHYTTGGLPAIKGILETGFRISYNKEINPQIIGHFGNSDGLGMVFAPGNVGVNYQGIRYQHIPMVCFCDIRLSAISDHLKTYGFDAGDNIKRAYAIGLTKTWGQKNGLNPILYLVPGSDLSTQMASAIQYAPGNYDQFENGRQAEIYSPPRSMGDGYIKEDNNGNKFPLTYLYSKVIERVQLQGFGPSEKFTNNYQDEKEWRYIPKDASIIDHYEWNASTSNRFLYDTMRTNALKAIGEAKYPNLTFNHSDIAHIIVSNDDEVLEVHEVLDKKFSNLSPKERSLLFSKVNSFESMSRDW